MTGLVELGLSNALMAAALAVGAGLAGRLARRRPALVHGLWVLVLLRLLAPPLWSVPVGTFETSPTHVFEPAGESFLAVEERVASSRISGSTRISPAPGAQFSLDAGLTSTGRDPVAEDLAADLPTSPAAVAPTRPLEIPNEPTPRGAEASALSPSPPGGLDRLDWRTVAGAAWLAGSLGWLGCVLARVRRFRRALRHAAPAGEPLRRRTEILADRLGLRRVPGVLVVPGAISPMVWGYGRGVRVIVPGALWERLDDPQRDALILHELAHLRRGDHWVRLLELAATGLYWWNPVVWWTRRALGEAEEACCDAWVVWATGPGSGRAYATALVEAVDFLSRTRPVLPPAGSGMSRVRHLSRRIVMIMKGTTPRSLSWLGLLLLIALGALTLTWLPIRAQPGPPGQALLPFATQLQPRTALIDNAAIRQEVAILEAQLAQKRAFLRGAEASSRIARTRLERATVLADRAAVSSTEPAEAQAQVEIADAEVQARQAEVQEYEIRLDGARRSLGVQTAPPTTVAPPAPVDPANPVDIARSYPRTATPTKSAETKSASQASADSKNQAAHKLKQIGLAIHNHIDATGAMRPAITRPDDTPLLSWRVAILPYLDQNDLYQKFKLDEPWNSPHNLALLEEMPDVFASRDTGYPGLTFAAALVGPETAWDESGGDGIQIAKVYDGTSNTLAVVESSFPIPWTSPQDIAVPAASYEEGGMNVPPIPPLGTPGSRETLVLYLDGSVRTLSKTINPMVFHALTTRAGGEVVSQDQQGEPVRATKPAPEAVAGMMGMMMGGGTGEITTGMPGMMGGMMGGGPPPGMGGMMGGPPPGMEAMMGGGPGGRGMTSGIGGMESMMAGGYGGMEMMPGGEGMMGMGMGMAPPQVPEPSDRDRLDALEQKLDRLLEAMEQLRGAREDDPPLAPAEEIEPGEIPEDPPLAPAPRPEPEDLPLPEPYQAEALEPPGEIGELSFDDALPPSPAEALEVAPPPVDALDVDSLDHVPTLPTP